MDEECSVCLTPVPVEVIDDVVVADWTGWVEGEFGPMCPTCAAKHVEPGGDAGVDAIAEALGAKKDKEPDPIGIEFSVQLRNNETMGGCVDYEPGYDPATAPPPERPKPDVMVRIRRKKEKP